MGLKTRFLVTAIFITSVACAIRIGPSPPPSPCEIETLLLDASLFHRDIRQTGPPSKDGAPLRFGVNKLGVGFTSMTQGGATQHVYEGRNVQQTKEKFLQLTTSEFSTQEGYTAWYRPNTFNYQSSVADQFRLGCHRHQESQVELCQFIGQYDVYLIVLHTHISSLLSHQDMERLLQAIDTKVTRCLNN